MENFIVDGVVCLPLCISEMQISCPKINPIHKKQIYYEVNHLLSNIFRPKKLNIYLLVEGLLANHRLQIILNELFGVGQKFFQTSVGKRVL